jgi:osmotically-inducible protein OsmY
VFDFNGRVPLSHEVAIMRVSGVLICLGIAAGGAASAQAQYYNGQLGSSGPGSSPYSSGGGGMFGSRNVGNGSISAGQRTFNGSQSQGGADGGTAVGSMDGSERFLRGNRQGQFVGSDGADTGFVGGVTTGMNGMGGMNNRGMMQNFQQGRNNQQYRNRNQNQQARNRQVRTSLSLGFKPPSNVSSQATQRISGILKRSQHFEAVTPLAVEMRGRMAVLTGTVTSEADRDLVARVVLLEPGISQVQNDLMVAGEDTGSDADVFPEPPTNRPNALAPPGSEASAVAPAEASVN